MSQNYVAELPEKQFDKVSLLHSKIGFALNCLCIFNYSNANSIVTEMLKTRSHKTEYLWEQYDQKNGNGKGAQFTGWKL